MIDGTVTNIDEYMDGLGQCVLAALCTHDSNKTDNIDTAPETAETLTLEAAVITWEKVQEASAKDNQIQDLLSIIKDNEIDDKDKWSRNVAEFYPVRSHLSCQGNVVFYKDRIVIPSSLRSLVLNILHSGQLTQQ